MPTDPEPDPRLSADRGRPAPEAEDARDWSDAPLPELVDHVIARFHRPLDAELPRLQALAEQVHRAHRETDPARFDAILEAVSGLHMDLVDHMGKEERILFPMIAAGDGAGAAMPIQVMGMEHEAAQATLERLRDLTSDYTIPPEACRRWRALWAGLAELDADLQVHIRLEDEVLFPRALS